MAILLLLVDLAEGRPLWTPAALGSALFTGERLLAAEFDPWARLELIVGYTAVHGAINIGFAAWLSFFLVTIRRRAGSTPVVAAIASVLLFVLLELTFLAQAWLFQPSLADDLAAGWVGAANTCAAVAMGVYLARSARPLPRGPDEQAAEKR